VEKSLVIAEEQEGETRYRMLETLRQHSRDKLREAGEERELRRRHLRWFRDLAEQGERAWHSAAQDLWQRRLQPEVENCRVALIWCRIEPNQQETGLRLATALRNFWHMSGHAHEASDWLTTLLIGAPLNATRAKALQAAGWLALRRGDPDAAQPSLDEALSLARTLGERAIIVATLRDLAGLRLLRGDPAAAQAALEEGLIVAEMPDVIPWRYTLLRLLGRTVAAMGRTEEAVAHFREAVRLAREQDDLYHVRLGLSHLGTLLLDLDQLGAARECLEDSFALETLGPSDVQTLVYFAGLAAAEGDLVGAVRLAGAVTSLAEAWPGRLPPAHAQRLQQYLKTTTQALSPTAHRAAWSEGAAMTLDETIDCALRRVSESANGPVRPGGLTPRELEVAELVACGLTNRQIAASLVISRRTADRHVDHILGKLGLSNRAQVAVWAVGRGLAQPADS